VCTPYRHLTRVGLHCFCEKRNESVG
ncbi:unnamed protein product, partial [Allacma fusca]